MDAQQSAVRPGGIAVAAHAKVNLDLRVVAVRPDGYHDLDTIFQALVLHDTVRVQPAAGPPEVRCDARGVPLDRGNLVWRAADALAAHAGFAEWPSPVTIAIEKRIPVQSGLGGGSANAAAALLALDAAWGLGLGRERLARLGAALGADVPFFFTGGTARGLGRGDRLLALPDLPPHHVVLARPPAGVSTADAYRWFDESTGGRCPPPAAGAVHEAPDLGAGWPRAVGVWRNDLEAPVIARHPEIGWLALQLRAHGAVHAAMTGSGSAVFGLFDACERAERAAAAVAAAGVWVALTETLAGPAVRDLSPGGLSPL